MTCADDERGKIHNLPRYRQPVCFGGLKYGRITPTDVDGLIEYRSKVFVFYELKLRNTQIPEGQKKALERIVNVLRDNGKHAVLFKCEHDVGNTDEQVDASEAEVTEVYFDGKWLNYSGRTAREVTDSYFKYLKGKYNADTPLDE